MKRHVHLFNICVLTILIASTAGCDGLFADNPVEGWAILAEKDVYSGLDMTDIIVDYIDIARMRKTLELSGWNPDQIHDLKEFDRETLQAELDWLEESSDKNDIVILYISSHSGYLHDVLLWREFFAEEWSQIASQRRLLIVDACHAANFINAPRNDPNPHLSIAAVAGDELGWHGIEEEGLPIIGAVFTFYLTDALNNLDADANGNGMVSVQEALVVAEEQQRTYMHEVVLVVPEFVEMFHAFATAPERDPDYPDVIFDDTIGEPLYLTLPASP